MLSTGLMQASLPSAILQFGYLCPRLQRQQLSPGTRKVDPRSPCTSRTGAGSTAKQRLRAEKLKTRPASRRYCADSEGIFARLTNKHSIAANASAVAPM